FAKTSPARTPFAKTSPARTPFAKTSLARTPFAKTSPARTPLAKTSPARMPLAIVLAFLALPLLVAPAFAGPIARPAAHTGASRGDDTGDTDDTEDTAGDPRAPHVDHARGRASSGPRWESLEGDGASKGAAPPAASGMARGTPPSDLARAPADADPDVPAGTPAIGAVLSAAYATAGLDHDPGRSWIRRARLSGLIPWITVRTTRDTSWQDDQSEVGHGTTLELRATWRLDRLLFDGRELQVASIEATRRRERRRLASRVIRAYFTWRRAAAAAAGSSAGEATATRLAETTAELDALTDGWFSDELARPAHGSAEPSTRRAPRP
ncbi:MAG TPA: hypothetical protein VH165_07995, partial [Kofleriaceae bacterium]|nr:hypothetical protein [Kofleriaceae bacterium]